MKEPIKISIDVNINFSDDSKSFIAQVFNGIKAPVSSPATTQAPTSSPATTKAPTSSPTTTQAPTSSPATTQASEEISIEDVRKALSLKVNNHRAEIKDKLTELGAPSVTKLDPAKYKEMLDFLNTLD